MKIAIIPARGGSKRIPRKNIRDFLGVPILARTIKNVLDSGVFDKVVVSTDSEEVRSVAIAAGAEVPFLRSVEASQDTATLHQAVCETITNLPDGQYGEYSACVLPTAVMLSAKHIQKAWETLQSSEGDSLFSVQKFPRPVQRALIENEDGYLVPREKKYFQGRTQDLDPCYFDAGQIYFFKSDDIINRSRVVSEEALPYLLEEVEVQDIDVEEDWKIAELKFKLTNKNNEQ